MSKFLFSTFDKLLLIKYLARYYNKIFVFEKYKINVMYKEPIKVLKKKVPFVEFLLRLLLFIKSPYINKNLYNNLDTHDLKYALYDIILALSASYIVCAALSCLFFDINFDKFLTLIENPILIYIDILVKAYFSVLIFFLLFLIIFLPIYGKETIKLAFLSSLQYARWYSIFIFIILLVFWIVFMETILHLKDPYKIIQEHSATSWIILILFILILFRCCIIPIVRLLELTKKRYFFLTFLIFLAVTSFNLTSRMLPTVRINKDFLYQIIIKKYNLTPEQEKILKEFLKRYT